MVDLLDDVKKYVQEHESDEPAVLYQRVKQYGATLYFNNLSRDTAVTLSGSLLALYSNLTAAAKGDKNV